MTARLRQVVLDVADLESATAFWSAVLGWPITFRDADWVSFGTDGSGIALQRVDEHRAPAWPDPYRPQQLHIDLEVDDIEAAEAAVLANGGVRLGRHPEASPPFRVYADPAGHPFCLEY